MANYCSQCGVAVQTEDQFCTSCGNQINQSVTRKSSGFSEKRARVLGKNNKASRNKYVVTLFSLAIFVLGAVSYIQSLPEKGNPLIKSQPVVSTPVNYPNRGIQMASVIPTVNNGKISIPFDAVLDNKFISFKYNSIPLLAYISNEGKLVTAVSMCEPCNSTKFHIKGESLICNSCGTKWELNDLSEISGACGDFPPDVIPSVVRGNEVQIDESIVGRWRPRI